MAQSKAELLSLQQIRCFCAAAELGSFVHALRSLEDAAESVGELTSMRTGVVALGTFNAPAPWPLDELVTSFLRRHPRMTVRLVGRNSSRSAERVRRGDLEAAVVVLPIDDDRLDVHPLVRDEVLSRRSIRQV